MPITIDEHQQGLSLGRRYELFEINLTQYSLGYIRLYEGDEGDSPVYFGGIPYAPWPLISTGWEVSGTGTLPRPRFQVANVKRAFTAMVLNANQFRFAPFTRTVTYEIFLDGGTDADPTQHDPLDVLEINRVVKEGLINGVEAIEWEIISPIDRPNSKLPRILVVRDHCQHRYRRYDAATGQFDYTHATCPYPRDTGGQSYYYDDNPVPDAEDRCSFMRRSCKARFGNNAVLPMIAFPAIDQTKVK